MAVQVDKDLLWEGKAHSFTAEASELRWKPGFLPRVIRVPGLGNEMDLELVHSDGRRFRYEQIAGIVSVTVFND